MTLDLEHHGPIRSTEGTVAKGPLGWQPRIGICAGMDVKLQNGNGH